MPAIYGTRKSTASTTIIITPSIIACSEWSLSCLLSLEKNRYIIAPDIIVKTFISVDKLAESEKRDIFLNNVGATAYSEGCSYAIKANFGGKTYASILVPPVVIDYRSKDLEGPIKIVEERIAKGDAIKIKGVEGTVEFDMANALADIKNTISKSDTVRTVKDGTHRTYLAYLLNKKFYAELLKLGICCWSITWIPVSWLRLFF